MFPLRGFGGGGHGGSGGSPCTRRERRPRPLPDVVAVDGGAVRPRVRDRVCPLDVLLWRETPDGGPDGPPTGRRRSPRGSRERRPARADEGGESDPRIG